MSILLIKFPLFVVVQARREGLKSIATVTKVCWAGLEYTDVTMSHGSMHQSGFQQSNLNLATVGGLLGYCQPSLIQPHLYSVFNSKTNYFFSLSN